ncbi:MAG: type II methionyl aminopeptidase, partial [Candidatus Micrarchaeota archaeon]|nr:type II methionyl aminopeptidase [Candidatus Micrarchaeota archaeon]
MLEKYLLAGKIAREALEYGKKLIRPGKRLLDIAERVEARIVELGGKPAFPVNISLNDVAAHDTPEKNDERTIGKDDYVKLDVGVHVDGFIADTALTVRPSGKDELIRCAEEMLKAAIEVFRPGTELSAIGKLIQDVASGFGFSSVRNLTGHGLGRFDLHAGSVVPNVYVPVKKKIVEGEVYAIEPFCTPGDGVVKEENCAFIYRWVRDVGVRVPAARKILDLGKNKFSRLPFAKRWVDIPEGMLEISLKKLTEAGALHPYMVLREVSGQPVAQAEHTVIVSD